MKNKVIILKTLVFAAVFCHSCINECDENIADGIRLPLEVLNRQDTINMNDSIVFYSKFTTERYDESLSRNYSLKDLNMIMGISLIHIKDSISLPNMQASSLLSFFDYRIEEGSEYGSAQFIPLLQNDSMIYKIILYPKDTGLFRLQMGIISNYQQYDEEFMIINEDEDGCLLTLDQGISAQPGLGLGIYDYNNFSVYYYSGLFHPGGVDITEYDHFQNASRLAYYVYVE